MYPLAIVDPALGRTGAHNLGFVGLLMTQGADAANIGVWCNTSISAGLRDRMTAQGLTIKPTFSLDFYQILTKGGGAADHWDWIYGLATDYLVALEQILVRWPAGSVSVIYHTLSWEHATALSLAIRLLGGRGDRLHHLAFLMYSPGLDESGTVLDVQRRLNFATAFTALSKLDGVHLYASCGEYAAAYAALLGLQAPLPIHPCFLGDWRLPPERREQGHARQVLLYVGEIKQDKGFLDLPEVLSRLLATSPRDWRFVIQFVEVRNEAGARVLEALTTLAVEHEQVEIHHGFWPDEKLHEVMSSSSVFYLNYDALLYAHKTSGLLWLAAWHELAVVVPQGSWLEREAKRLGVALIADAGALADGPVIDHEAFDRAYFQTVFTPFWSWLEQITDGLARTSAARAMQAAPVRGHTVTTPALANWPIGSIGSEAHVGGRVVPVPPIPSPAPVGATIVLFWKQNDTTLYGRRCDMVARYLASRADVTRVIVVDAPIDEDRLATLAASRNDANQDRWIHARTLAKTRGTCDVGKISYEVFTYPAGQYAFSEEGMPDTRFVEDYTAFLRRMFAQVEVAPRQCVFWIYPRDFCMPQLLEKFTPSRVVVDVVDDHRAWPNVSESMKHRLTENYRDLLASADMAFANCPPVRDAMRTFCPDIHLVPNGCDADPPRLSPDDDAFRVFLNYPGKTIGYAGNLESKIDIALVSKLAQRFRDCQIVLLGSAHANPKVMELLQHPNVFMPGVVVYDQLGAWLSRFDVGLIPHLDTELTRHMNPLKAYVYLSWGVPVVATATPNIETQSRLIRIGDTHSAFIEHVSQVLEGANPSPQDFRRYVVAHSWEARFARHVDMLDLAGCATGYTHS